MIPIFFIFNAPSDLLLDETNGEHYLSTRIIIFREGRLCNTFESTIPDATKKG